MANLILGMLVAISLVFHLHRDCQLNALVVLFVVSLSSGYI